MSLMDDKLQKKIRDRWVAPKSYEGKTFCEIDMVNDPYLVINNLLDALEEANKKAAGYFELAKDKIVDPDSFEPFDPYEAEYYVGKLSPLR